MLVICQNWSTLCRPPRMRHQTGRSTTCSKLLVFLPAARRLPRQIAPTKLMTCTHHPRELCSRPNVELAVDTCQMRLDRLDAHECIVSDLAIGPASGDQLGDLIFRRRKGVRSRGATTDPANLSQSLRFPKGCAQRVKDA